MTNTSSFDFVSKFFDSYNRVARLYPALIALAPIVWSLLALFPSIGNSASNSAAFLVAASCACYFLASLARFLGKRAEVKLLARWGGWPTTILLRHRDRTFDPLTRSRYHRALEVMCQGLTLPTAQQEMQDEVGADDHYRTATKKLIEQRRGREYRMLHNENASYGFRRNLYGLKPVAIAQTIILMGLTGFGWWFITPKPYTRPILTESVINYPHFPVLLALDLGYLLLWLGVVTPTFVYQAGREYSEALLRTLDT